MKTILAILLTVVCAWAYAQQSSWTPDRTQGILDAVIAQRNEAQNQAAALHGEVVVLRERIKELEKMCKK